MRLLMTADAVGGVWQYSLDLARGLIGNGVEVVLATMGPRPTASQLHQARHIRNLTLVESDFALEWMQDPWRDVDASTEWLQTLAQRHGVDVVHLNGYAQAATRWDIPVLVVAHSCVYSWWAAVHRQPPSDGWSTYHTRVAAGLAGCHAVVAPTEFMARVLRTEYNVAASKIRVVHNFSRAPRTEAAKRRFCLAVGRIWDQAKNLHALDQIAPFIPWPIKVAGPTTDPQTGATSQSRLKILGLLEHSRLMSHMEAASLFLHPALYEPFGLSVLEAARARCCLVLSDIPSLRELWDGAAIFVDPRAPEHWSREIQTLIRSPYLCNRLGTLAQERSARYSAFESVKEYLALYRTLRNSNRREKEVAA